VSIPLFGFPGERLLSEDTLVYRCSPSPAARVYVWSVDGGRYGVNMYRHPGTEGIPTHYDNRVNREQDPIVCADPFEVQLAIFHLIQTHLPTEVTTNEAA
jgi:hypothetical protein